MRPTDIGLPALWLSVCCLATAACAAPTSLVRPARLAEVQIVDRTTDEVLPIYGHRGQHWVAGTPGHRYAIRVRNRTGGRILAVMSVDGINVLSGETAGWDQRGYVFAPGESDDIAGWRKSQSRIADFEFAALGDSYAARTGRPDQVGVIGLALFREARRPEAGPRLSMPQAPASEAGAPERSEAPAPETRAQSKSADEAPRVARPEPRERLGTAHGRGEDSWVDTTSFERAQSGPDEIITIRYDRRESLVALGVIAPAEPDPFPESEPGFVPDPPGR
jgi:hypothetical protein